MHPQLKLKARLNYFEQRLEECPPEERQTLIDKIDTIKQRLKDVNNMGRGQKKRGLRK